VEADLYEIINLGIRWWSLAPAALLPGKNTWLKLKTVASGRKPHFLTRNLWRSELRFRRFWVTTQKIRQTVRVFKYDIGVAANCMTSVTNVIINKLVKKLLR